MDEALEYRRRGGFLGHIWRRWWWKQRGASKQNSFAKELRASSPRLKWIGRTWPYRLAMQPLCMYRCDARPMVRRGGGNCKRRHSSSSRCDSMMNGIGRFGSQWAVGLPCRSMPSLHWTLRSFLAPSTLGNFRPVRKKKSAARWDSSSRRLLFKPSFDVREMRTMQSSIVSIRWASRFISCSALGSLSALSLCSYLRKRDSRTALQDTSIGTSERSDPPTFVYSQFLTLMPWWTDLLRSWFRFAILLKICSRLTGGKLHGLHW